MHIVVFFHHFNEFFHCGTAFGIEFFGVGGVVHKFGAGDFKAVVFEILLNVAIGFKSARDDDFFFILVEVFCTEVDEFKFKIV